MKVGYLINSNEIKITSLFHKKITSKNESQQDIKIRQNIFNSNENLFLLNIKQLINYIIWDI